MRDPNFEQVGQLAAETFEISEADVSLESSPATIANWDSLQHLNFILALETRFQVEFSADEMEAVHSIADAVRIVGKKQSPSSQ